MKTPFLVAALSGGLREGLGHITLVSDGSAIEGEIAQRVSYLASIVRDSGQNVMVGDEYIGIRTEGAVQSSSGRIAPEVLLLCNVRTAALSEEKKQWVISQLESRMDALAELREDCPTRATRTMAASSTLERWFRLDGFDKLPSFRTGSNKGQHSGQGQVSWFWRGVAGIFVVGLMIGLAVYWFPKPTADTPVVVKKDPTPPTPIPPRPDKQKEIREQWYKNLEDTVLTKLDPREKESDRFPQFKELINQLETWPDDDNRAKACMDFEKQLGAIATRVSSATNLAAEKLADVEPNELSAQMERVFRSRNEQDAVLYDVANMEKLLCNLHQGKARGVDEFQVESSREIGRAFYKNLDRYLGGNDRDGKALARLLRLREEHAFVQSLRPREGYQVKDCLDWVKKLTDGAVTVQAKMLSSDEKRARLRIGKDEREGDQANDVATFRIPFDQILRNAGGTLIIELKSKKIIAPNEKTETRELHFEMPKLDYLVEESRDASRVRVFSILKDAKGQRPFYLHDAGCLEYYRNLEKCRKQKS